MRAALLGLALAASTLVACGGDPPARAGLSPADAERVLIDRNWMDRWPEHKDDRLQLYRFTPSMGGGVFQDRTVFKGNFELFQYQEGDQTIEFHFPETDETVRSSYLIERVRGHEPFDLKLLIAHDPRGKGVYWSRTDMKGEALAPIVPVN